MFHELWQKEKEFGVFLQSSLRHTLNAFIENPGYTLAEVPRFLTNSAFRSHFVANMKHEYVSAEFWRGEFAAKRDSDQEAYLRPFLNRVNELLANRFVRHIVGQTDTTIDFCNLIEERAIVLVTFSPTLSVDINRAIGSMLVSELMHAVKKRGELELSAIRCVFT